MEDREAELRRARSHARSQPNLLSLSLPDEEVDEEVASGRCSRATTASTDTSGTSVESPCSIGVDVGALRSALSNPNSLQPSRPSPSLRHPPTRKRGWLADAVLLSKCGRAKSR